MKIYKLTMWYSVTPYGLSEPTKRKVEVVILGYAYHKTLEAMSKQMYKLHAVAQKELLYYESDKINLIGIELFSNFNLEILGENYTVIDLTQKED